MLALAAAVLCAALCCFPASANHVPELEIDAVLRPDGSAAITQVWTADTDQGTEFYLACRDSGYLEIMDFAVSDDSGPYTLLEHWDVDAPLEEKAGRCGIVETEEGVELCWGIGEYGRRRYTVSYVLHGLTGAYDDADGFNHRFVDEMGTFPTHVSLTIRMEDGTPLTDGNCGIWAFGYDGDIRFEDGVIRAESETPLDIGQHMTVMVRLEKGVLSPARQMGGSFEDVKAQAFAGSDYEDIEEAGPLETAIGLAMLLAFGGLIALGFVLAAKCRKARMNKRTREAEYFRDAPNGGSLNVTHRLGEACKLCREDALLGAYLLRLIHDGALEPEEAEPDAKRVNLRLMRPPRSGNSYDDAFYTILEAAAGADGVLQAKELERFCEQNAKPLASFAASCQKDADRALIRGGCLRGAFCEGVKSLTPKGQRELDEILGLKRFLLDFSLIYERGVGETVLWQDYLIYAHLLGIADKVAPQIRKLYPDALPQVERFERYIGYSGYYSGYMYSACARELRQRQVARSTGRGGRASLGGGGGFSGGGGGGTR